ncbi:MAG: aspartate/glutamate racemase family protein [Alphaproteobacteria bacterium]
MKLGLIGTATYRGKPSAVPAEVSAVLSPSDRAQVYLSALNVFPRDALELKLLEVGYIDAGLRAAADGNEALVINSMGDYGLAALRAGAGVPVLGSGEAGLRKAASLGGKFAIVTVWPESTAFLYRQLLREAGLESRCAAVLHVGQQAELESIVRGTAGDAHYVARMQGGDATMLDRVVQACEQAVRQHGAASILLGCTCMSPVAAKIAARVSVPVVDSLVEAIGCALRGDVKAQARPFSYARRDATFAAMAQTGKQSVKDEVCEVCVVAEEAAQ